MTEAWLEVSFEVSESDIGALERCLHEYGALAITLAAADEQRIYGEPGDSPQVWAVTRVTALFAAGVDLDALGATVEPFQPCAITELAERPWHETWMANYQPLQFGNRLWLRPSWCAPVTGASCEVVLDPGMAFGTGTHPTTQLCLEWLCSCADLPGASLIDYGCGSGILGIAAVKLGAARVTAIDIDPHAQAATRTNARRNNIDERVSVLLAGDQPPAADILIANILLRPLLELGATFADLLAPGGRIALSGLTAEQTNQCLAAYSQWFSMDQPVLAHEWALLHGIRRQPVNH